MNKVLIFYPEEFNCYTKFERKLDSILQFLDGFNLLFINDFRSFIGSYGEARGRRIEPIESIDYDSVTHAILFDDGEVFYNEYHLLKSKGIKVRAIKIKITRVINIKVDKEYAIIKSNEGYEYIGRGGYWGNPYSMFEDGDREEVIRKFSYDFEFDKFPNKNKKEVYKLAGKRLGCFCKPQACHGDVLAEFLNSWDDGE